MADEEKGINPLSWKPPTIGRIVLLTKRTYDQTTQKLGEPTDYPAMVCKVWNDGKMCNLVAWDENGVAFAQTSVAYNDNSSSASWRWPTLI